jgi:hypothetical protein
MTEKTLLHHRALVELAVLFTATGVADLFAELLVRRHAGRTMLMTLGAAVVLVTLAHHLWIRRGTVLPPGRAALGGHEATKHAAETVGTLWRVRTAVDDTPGRLAVLAAAIAALGANILTMQVYPVDSGVVDEFLIQAPQGITASRLIGALSTAGGGQVRVTQADLHALVDAPTHALGLAARLAREPETLHGVLADLLGTTRIVWQPTDTWQGEGIDGTRMYLRDPASGFLIASRPDLPFTPTEFARARAMADLAAAVRHSRALSCP